MASGAGKDLCRHECTDQTHDSLKNQGTSQICEDNEDTKEDKVASQAGVNSSVTSRNSQSIENENGMCLKTTPFSEDHKQHSEVKNKNNETNHKPTPEHRQGTEHDDGIGEEVTFPEETRQNEENENSVTKSSPKMTSETSEQSQPCKSADVIIQETLQFSDNTKQPTEKKMMVADSSPRTTRVAPEHSQGDEHEGIIGKEATLFPEDTQQNTVKQNYFNDYNNKEIARVASKHRQDDKHKDVIRQEPVQPQDMDGTPKTSHSQADAPAESQDNEQEDILGQDPTQFLGNTKRHTEIKIKDMEGSPKANKAIPDHCQSGENKVGTGEEATLFPDYTKQQNDIKADSTDSSPKTIRVTPEHSQGDKHEDNIKLDATALSDNTNKIVGKGNGFLDCNQKLTREASDQSQANNSEYVIIPEAAQFLDDTNYHTERNNVVTDSSPNTNSVAPVDHQNVKHENVLEKEPTCFPDDTKLQIEMKDGVIDSFPKTTPVECQDNNHEDVIGQKPTHFPDNTNLYIEIRKNVNDGFPETTRVTLEHGQGIEQHEDIIEKEATLFSEGTRLNLEKENEFTNHIQKMARALFNHRQDDQPKRAVGQEPTDFPGNTKPHTEIKNEVMGASPNTNRATPDQCQADEHKDVGEEITLFPDDTNQQKNIKDEITDSSSKSISLAPEHSQGEDTIGLKATTLSPTTKENNLKLTRVAPDKSQDNEQEDILGQEPTQFLGNTKRHTEIKIKDMEGSPKANKAIPDHCQSGENKVGTGEEATLFPDYTKQQNEIKADSTDSSPKTIRVTPEHNQGDKHEDNIKLDATALSDNTNKNVGKGNGFLDCNQKLTREASDQSQANNSEYVIVPKEEPTKIYKKALQFRDSEEEEGRQKDDHSTYPHQEEHMQQNGKEKTMANCKEKRKLEIADTKTLFSRLNLVEKHKQKIQTMDVLQITSFSLRLKESCTEKDLVQTFLQRLLMMNYRMRYMITKEEDSIVSHHPEPGTGDKEEKEDDGFAEFFSKKATTFQSIRQDVPYPIHPMDVQMAVYHCSDHFLKQIIVNKLAQCQYALPLLVPNPFTKQITFPLWTFRQIRKSWKTTDSSGKKISKTQAMCEAETPMVAFFRFGSASLSKSQLMNCLISEKHDTFFHRHCPGSSKNRVLLDGVVEIDWYCPSGEETDHFPDCVAFCNLHGDAETNKEQLNILTEMSSVNVALISDTKEATFKEIIHKLYRDTKPLICLMSDDESGVKMSTIGKYRIGLKDRNNSDVARNLKMTIKESLSKSPSVFKIKHLTKHKVLVKDEDDQECKKAKELAKMVLSQLEGREISKLKEEFLPCQGKLWHDWCEINKDLHRLQGNNLEVQKSEKICKMKQIREEQYKCRLSGLMEQFISSLNSSGENERLFFLKWIEILLDRHTSDDQFTLNHIYHEKWTVALDLKNNHDKSDKIKHAQTELEDISKKLNAATFGLEHILREMAQIYESFISVPKGEKESEEKIVYSFPKLAAELLKSGHPLELMDGDAAHVPLTWVSAVLDELVNILGDQKVFVLSVLGIQSSGKSTMLNAMFGLQFAVSAGRCTRGAFMQLVSVSEEMKEELKFDYILIVDTEGLRALELTGKSPKNYDNELAIFVIGLGNMTLINIFGESHAEMQDILQIVVQAFLRMKKVRLNPSCMFVHQNVGDITTREKTMEGRRHLQERLDEMTKFAAKVEDSDAECFSDVIKFNVQDDVYYFAQLWEGSPPMAPPNPRYSRNVQNLKNAIFKKSPRSHNITFSQFKLRISDLWNALLNENFVFSFKNTLEIAVYKKMENEFVQWTWTLRSAMLDIEEKLYNRTEIVKLEKIAEKDLYSSMKESKEEVDKLMKSYFEGDKDKNILIQWRVRCETKMKQLHENLVKDTQQNLNEIIQQQQARETHKKTQKEYEAKLFNLSKELSLKFDSKDTDEEVRRQEFDKVWDKCVTEVTENTPPERKINFWEDAVQILSVGNEQASVFERKSQQEYKEINKLGEYSCYIVLHRTDEPHKERKNIQSSDCKHDETKPAFEDQKSVGTLSRNVINDCEKLINEIGSKIKKLGYKDSYILEITELVKRKVKQHHNENQRIKLTKSFTLDLCLHACELAIHKFNEFHKQFREENDIRVYLSKQKPQYYSVFENYCKGASNTKVFGEMICSNLRESMLQAINNKTALDLTAKIRSDMPEFNGNRSNLEKSILKCLAEEEDFEKYKEYIHNPQKHFKHFVTEKVDKYISDNNNTVLNLFKGNLKNKAQRVINVVHIVTDDVQNSGGDADKWLRSFNSSLKDELTFKVPTSIDLKEITDFDFLQQVVSDGLSEMMSELDKSFNSVKDIDMEKFRRKSDDILIEHLSQCCWVQCPFCFAICTNTIEGHDGDHSIPFHRVNGISGMYYRATTDLCCEFCTTLVQSEKCFYHTPDTDISVPYKSYRSAGGEYASWSITPDNSQLPYWKWFVCRFQEDLEKYYKKTFQGSGEIPSEWRKFTKMQAVESLE